MTKYRGRKSRISKGCVSRLPSSDILCDTLGKTFVGCDGLARYSLVLVCWMAVKTFHGEVWREHGKYFDIFFYMQQGY